jgi:hypothetical protein
MKNVLILSPEANLFAHTSCPLQLKIYIPNR